MSPQGHTIADRSGIIGDGITRWFTCIRDSRHTLGDSRWKRTGAVPGCRPSGGSSCPGTCCPPELRAHSRSWGCQNACRECLETCIHPHMATAYDSTSSAYRVWVSWRRSKMASYSSALRATRASSLSFTFALVLISSTPAENEAENSVAANPDPYLGEMFQDDK